MMYISLYAISKGLVCITTAFQCKRALMLGGIHKHKLFMLDTNDFTPTLRRAELAICSLLKNPKKLDFLRSLQVLFFDEAGQVSDEMFAILDIILRKVRNSNIYMGGVLIIMTLDPCQIQPDKGRPFMTSVHTISCFKMVNLHHSVRASSDLLLQRIQAIARMNYRCFDDNPGLAEEFEDLCSRTFTFVTDWNDARINTSTMRLYSKRVPAREASNQYMERVIRQLHPTNVFEKVAEDVQKSRYSHQDWNAATEVTKSKLDQKLREPRRLLFFRGAIYEVTYNVEGQFSNTQLVLLYDMPSQDDIQSWSKIKLLKCPLGTKEIIFNPEASKQSYTDQGFKEIKVGIAPQYSNGFDGHIQAKRKQYGLRHRVASTIHNAMGDTLPSVAIEISQQNSNFKMWDKGQMVVVTSRTKLGKDTIFVGNKNDVLKSLKFLLTRRTQWTDLMDDILRVITVNYSSNSNGSITDNHILTQDANPFRICDVSLPECNTGYVYMLVSSRDRNHVYIEATL